MSCDRKITCFKYLRRGPCACTGCTYSDGPAEGPGEDTGVGNVDDYGNEGSNRYTVVMRYTSVEYSRIEVAADDEETAVSRAREVVDNGEANWQFDNDEVEPVDTEDGWDD